MLFGSISSVTLGSAVCERRHRAARLGLPGAAWAALSAERSPSAASKVIVEGNNGDDVSVEKAGCAAAEWISADEASGTAWSRGLALVRAGDGSLV